MTRNVALLEDRAVAAAPLRDSRSATIVQSLGNRSVVLVGLMGCGKTSTGRWLARRLGLEFVDADTEIEWAAGMSISEIFETHGETYFRAGERRVMARLLSEGPRIIATGGGAFINEHTRAAIGAKALSVWLKADLDVLWRRVRRRTHRPLLKTADPEGTLRTLMEQRYPVYGRADLTVASRDGPHDVVVDDVLAALDFYLRFSPDLPDVSSTPVQVDQSPPLSSVAAAHRVTVELPERSYDILIGPSLLSDVGAILAERVPGSACAIVTDDNVAHHHLGTLQDSLTGAGIRHATVTVTPGEASKSYRTYETVADAVIAGKLERGDLVLALGGGVVGDLAGFTAATVRRGMRLVQIPTSLLAQVDSSVGGKTGINSPLGKNLIGAFHQPILVLADTQTLTTLPDREFAAGYAEVLKYGLLGDAAFFEWLEEHRGEIFAGGAARVEAVARCCGAKAHIVARDERETGDRALLNLGHTFGHALERLTNYDGTRLVHGEGVAIGIASAFRFSQQLGFCPAADVARVEAHLVAAGLPTRVDAIADFTPTPSEIVEAMGQDKKVERGALTFILVKGIGEAFVAKGIQGDEVLSFLEDDLKAKA